MNKYQELEQQIQTLQEEHQKRVRKLQEQVELLKREEQESELPAEFDREQVINFLNDPNMMGLGSAFNWSSTPQGHAYWDYIELDSGQKHEIPNKAKIQLQKWVIQSYQQEYGA